MSAKGALRRWKALSGDRQSEAANAETVSNYGQTATGSASSARVERPV